MKQHLKQVEFVEEYLRQHGSITRNYCLQNYISRLSAIIYILKDKGYEFEGRYFPVKTPFGMGKDYEYKVTKYPEVKEAK